VSYSALPVLANSAAAAGAAQNVSATAIEASIDFMAVIPFLTTVELAILGQQ
jgi:hypothetical protein